LLAEGDFARSLQGARLALSTLPVIDGQAVLALHEGIVDGLHDFLAELHESGLDLVDIWGVRRDEVDVAHMASLCGVSWREVNRLRDDGFDSAPLIGPSPIGSPEWLERMRQAMSVLQNPTWVADLAARVGSVPDSQVAAVDAVYRLLMSRAETERDHALGIARAVLAVAAPSGAERLALHEAVVFVLEQQLIVEAEHEELVVDPSGVEECEKHWLEVERLRRLGFSSESLIAPYVGGWMVPIGSRTWLAQTRKGVAHLMTLLGGA